MKKENYIQIIRYLLIILWVYAAGSKLWNYNAFEVQLSRQPLPHWSIPILQWFIPMIEIISVILLSSWRTITKGFLLSFILMLAFTSYVGFGLVHVYDKIPCSCGGILGMMGWGTHFIFNIIFTIVAFVGLYLMKTNGKRITGHHPVKA